MTLLFMAQNAYAQDAEQVCQVTVINQAFGESELASDREQLRKIQGLLSEYGYGELVPDGTMGPATLAALKRLCVDFEVTTTQDLAAQLIDLLEFTGMVWQTYPEWRQLIQRNKFKDWLKQQPKAEQEKMTNTLQSGPADQVIAILDASGIKLTAPVQAAPDPVASEPAPAPTKKKCKYAPAPGGGPMVFYRWQAEKEESEDDEEDSAQACEDVQLPEGVLEVLGALDGVAYPNEFLFKKALAMLFADTGIEYLSNQDQILQQARQGPDKENELLQLKDDSCGCSRDFSSLVVGFYPFWQAKDKDRVVDFSLFDRMGLYAFSLDEDNEFQAYPNWDNEHTKDFIKKAHRYGVKVDTTIYVSHWKDWTKAACAIAEYAAINISDVTKNDDKDCNSSDNRKDTLSVNADGITLYFDDYKEAKTGEKITNFIEQLTARLTKKRSWFENIFGLDSDKGYKLNIMLSMNLDKDLGENNRKLFKELGSILKKDSGLIDNVYLYLQEPTTDSKKKLRQIVEDAFKGENRRTVLRKIVPIISLPNNFNEVYIEPNPPVNTPDQFEDDLIYFQDNFAGVGLWPLPLGSLESSGMGITNLEEKLTRLFKRTDSPDQFRTMIDTYAPMICEFACPNRWLFRIGFDLLLGVLVLYALLAIWICRLRALYKQYFLYFLAFGVVTVLIQFISLVCDPFWMRYADTVIIAVFLVSLVATIWRYVSKATQPPLP